MNHYPRHIGDYLKKTIGLTMLQDGAYNRMLDLYYGEESPLPLDRSDIYTSTRCQNKADRDAVDYVLRRFFTETPDGFRHGRCDDEIARYAEKSAKASASASEKWKRAHANAMRTHPPNDANAEPTHSVGNANQNQNQNQNKPGCSANSMELVDNSPPNPAAINAEKPKPQPVAEWWRSNEGIEAKGKELGITARGGEAWPDYKTRLFEAINAGERRSAA